MLLVMYLSTGLVKQSMMISWRSLCLRICLRQVRCCSGSTADLAEREEAILSLENEKDMVEDEV